MQKQSQYILEQTWQQHRVTVHLFPLQINTTLAHTFEIDTLAFALSQTSFNIKSKVSKGYFWKGCSYSELLLGFIWIPAFISSLPCLKKVLCSEGVFDKSSLARQRMEVIVSHHRDGVKPHHSVEVSKSFWSSISHVCRLFSLRFFFVCVLSLCFAPPAFPS